MLRCVLVNTKPQTIRCLLAKQANTVILFGRSLSLYLSASLGRMWHVCSTIIRTYIDNPTVASAILYTTDSVCVFKSYQIFNCKCCMCDQDRHKRRDTTNARTRTFLFYFLYFCIISLNKKTLCDGCNVLFSKPKQQYVVFCRFYVFCRFCRCFYH